MHERENMKLIQAAYEAFGKQDMESMLALLAEDVEWRHPRADEIPWGGERRGREGVAQFFSAVTQRADLESFEPLDFIANDDTVIVLGRERGRVKATGKSWECDWAHVFRVKEGEIVSFQEYTDTAGIVEALRT